MKMQVLRGEKCTDLLKSQYTEVSIWLQLFFVFTVLLKPWSQLNGS